MESTFGSRLKELRITNELSLKELGEKIEISVATLSNYERNERKPDFDTLIKLSNYFNATTDYLLCVTDIRNVYETVYSTTQEEFNALLKTLDVNDRSIIYNILVKINYTIESLYEFDRPDILESLEEAYNSIFQIYTTTLATDHVGDSLVEMFRTYNHYKETLNSTLASFFESLIEQRKKSNNL